MTDEPLADVINLAGVEGREVDWLWYPYLPLGKLSILAGDPGVGKSFVGYALSTATSLGASIGDSDPLPKGRVLVMSAEDDVEDTIVPRLEAMGADRRMIDAVPLERAFILDDAGLERLKEITAASDYLFVFLDPLGYYLGAEADMHRQNQVRPMLQGLADIASDRDLTVVGNVHLNKSDAKAQYRLLGSIDFLAAARSVLLAFKTDDGSRGRALLHIKANVGPEGDPVGYDLTEGGGFTWRPDSDLTEADFERPDSSGRPSAEKDITKKFIRSYLERNGSTDAEEMNHLFKGVVSLSTVKRACKDLIKEGVLHKDPRGSRWYWELVQEATEPSQAGDLTPVQNPPELTPPPSTALTGTYDPGPVSDHDPVREESA